jgi:hypothetical protein
MFELMMKQCCGADGKPDFESMKQFMEQHDRASHLDSIGWALFFIWVGVAWLAGFDLGIGLLGVAIIVLGMQAIRRYLRFRMEAFWILAGVVFAIGGAWELMDIDKPIVPVLLVLVGLGISGSMFRHRHF